MSTYLFDQQYIFIRNSQEKITGTRCILSLGEKRKTVAQNYYMVDQSHGENPSRTQIDVTLDGQLHIIGTRIGVGSYTMYFFDAPVTNTDSKAVAKNKGTTNSSIFNWYTNTKSLSERQATVKLQRASVDGNTEKSTPVAYLDGIVTNASTAQKEIDGVLYFGTALVVTGVWQI